VLGKRGSLDTFVQDLPGRYEPAVTVDRDGKPQTISERKIQG
jgi:hypothetical protein